MRLTIERLRTMVLAAGVLLLVALAGFLIVGKWRNPFNKRDIPGRLGIDIQQEANGVTYTQARAGHTLFKLHASKVVQLKKGNALLHDVWIELYGVDGSRVDRIEGAEFEYDQQAGQAKATGPVEITLVRPRVAPAIAPKAAPDEKKDKPLKNVAEAATAGQVHVKTSGLVFDQKSGVARTSEKLTFTLAQGAGSAVGATYNSAEGLMVLDHAVTLEVRRGTETVELHAQHAEFERAAQICRLETATVEARGGQAAAGRAQILFRDDGSAERLDASGGITVTTANGGRMTAPVGTLGFDEHNQPQHGRVEGGVTLDAASLNRKVHGSAPSADLEFTAKGELRHAHLERNVAMDSEEESEAEGVRVRERRHWRSPVADVEFRHAANGRTEPSTIHGTGGVVVTGESQRDNGPLTPSKLAADDLTAQVGKDSALTAMNGVGHAGMEQTAANGARQTTSGDRLEAHFAPVAQKGAHKEANAGVRVGLAGAIGIQSAVIEGHAVLVQEPAAKAGAKAEAPMRATAGRAVYEGEGEWLHLTVNPRVEDGGLQVTADKIDIAEASGEAFAHGNVKASWLGQGGENGGRLGAPALGGQGPAHVVAAEAQMHQPTGVATFKGGARLWQQTNSVTAPVIVMDRQKQTLLARTTDRNEPVRAVLVSAGGAPRGGNKDAASKGGAPQVVRMRGGDLSYSDLERKAVMRAGVLGAVAAETGAASSISDEVEAILLRPGSHGSKESGAAEVDRLTARGHVVLTSEGRRGIGEQLVYTGATGEYVLTGTASVPPKMTDPARGTVTGEALIFHSRDDSVSIEGGARKTSTETTIPK